MDNFGIDGSTIATVLGGGSLISSLVGGATLWFRLRNMQREDTKARVVDDSWRGLVAELRAEIDFLKQEVKELRGKIEDCEAARESLVKRVSGALDKSKPKKAVPATKKTTAKK